MDRILLNPWVSRAGNLSFLIATGVLVYRLVRGQDPLWVLTIVLLGVGVALMAAPRVTKWRQDRAPVPVPPEEPPVVEVEPAPALSRFDDIDFDSYLRQLHFALINIAEPEWTDASPTGTPLSETVGGNLERLRQSIRQQMQEHSLENAITAIDSLPRWEPLPRASAEAYVREFQSRIRSIRDEVYELGGPVQRLLKFQEEGLHSRELYCSGGSHGSDISWNTGGSEEAIRWFLDLRDYVRRNYPNRATDFRRLAPMTIYASFPQHHDICDQLEEDLKALGNLLDNLNAQEEAR